MNSNCVDIALVEIRVVFGFTQGFTDNSTLLSHVSNGVSMEI